MLGTKMGHGRGHPRRAPSELLAQISGALLVVPIELLESTAGERRDHPNLAHNDAGTVDHPQEVVAVAEFVERAQLAPQQEEALEIAAMWLQGVGLEAINPALLLALTEELHCLVEDVEGRLLLPTLHGTPADEQRGISHLRLLSRRCLRSHQTALSP